MKVVMKVVMKIGCDEDDDKGSEEGWMIDSDRLGGFADWRTN